MAVVHGDGLAGQYAKSQARKLTLRALWWLAILGSFASGCIGVLLGVFVVARFSWARHVLVLPWWALSLLEIALFAGVALLIRKMDRPAAALMTERLKWLRGGQAEGLVGWYLRDLGKEWHVFHNVQLERSSDIDHIVIGPTGIFCIATKSNRGLYSLRPDGGHLLNGCETDHLKSAQRMTMQLRDRLEALLGQVPWIQSVLAAPFAFIDFPSFQPPVWVLHEENLLDALENRPRKLKAAEIERCARAVEMLRTGASEIYKREVPAPA